MAAMAAMAAFKKTRKVKKEGTQLFNDAPSGTPRTKGIGYGTAKRAHNSIKLLAGKDKAYRRQVATTMYYRAKYHKYQNKGMRDAMKVWGNYIKTL
jgi:hypothetical protein